MKDITKEPWRLVVFFGCFAVIVGVAIFTIMHLDSAVVNTYTYNDAQIGCKYVFTNNNLTNVTCKDKRLEFVNTSFTISDFYENRKKQFPDSGSPYIDIR